MNKHKIVVVKFGSSVLSTASEIPRAVNEVYQYLHCNYKVLVTLDLKGYDAAHKTVLISRIAFDQDPDHLDIRGIQHLSEKFIRDAQKQNKVIRLVAQCWREKDKVHATVKPLTLDRDHPLAQVIDANNAIIIRIADTASQHLHGKGAGRWPTAEAVFADLLALSSQHRIQPFISHRED